MGAGLTSEGWTVKKGTGQHSASSIQRPASNIRHLLSPSLPPSPSPFPLSLASGLAPGLGLCLGPLPWPSVRSDCLHLASWASPLGPCLSLLASRPSPHCPMALRPLPSATCNPHLALHALPFAPRPSPLAPLPLHLALCPSPFDP